MLTLRLLLSSLFLLVSVSLASADVPPPNLQGCQSKKVGDSCDTDDKKSGACQTQKCSRLDYSQGTPPKTVEYDCLLCQAGATPTTPKAGCQTLTSEPTSLILWLSLLALGLAFLRPQRPTEP